MDNIGSSDQLNQIVTFVRQSLHSERFNTIHESVFLGCWQGQTYQEIADDLGYDAVYIRGIGSQLWQKMSQAFRERVAKSNFQIIVQQRLAEANTKPAPHETHSSALPLTHLPMPSHTASICLQNRQGAEDVRSPSPMNTGSTHTCGASATPSPTSAVDYYSCRPPIEDRCKTTVLEQGALIRIKAPRQMGKTSLMTKILTHAKYQNLRTVIVSLRLADQEVFSNLDRFLQWFCAIVDDQLGLGNQLSTQWKPIFGSNYNCTHYFGQTLLPQLETPVVVALDDVDVLFEHTAIATDFLGLI